MPRTIRERRLNAIVGIDHAVDGVRGLVSDDMPSGFDWRQLVRDLREAAAVLRSANEDNEKGNP